MNINNYSKSILLFFVVMVILSSCHSRKALMKGDDVAKTSQASGKKEDVLKGQPGEIVKPQGSIADKYAELMAVDKRDIQNGRLYAFIDQWMGVPYKFGGLDKEGVDCSGLSVLLEQEVYGITIPRTTGQQVTVIKRKYEEELKEGDLVFFDFDGKQFSHVGVYLQNGYVVHASSTKGVMIVNLHSPSIYKYFSRGGAINFPVVATESGL
jgi:cell wall-associated NlpC family hydrolase